VYVCLVLIGGSVHNIEALVEEILPVLFDMKRVEGCSGLVLLMSERGVMIS